MMHLTCTNMPEESLHDALKKVSLFQATLRFERDILYGEAIGKLTESDPYLFALPFDIYQVA